MDRGDPHVVGAAPEVLVRVDNGLVTVRPIAGTRKRGKSAEEDDALAAELLADPKEIAEHLMLIDLGRNDVGRVSDIGSVRLTEQMVIERSEEHTSELQSLMRISYDVFWLKKKNKNNDNVT